MATITQTQTNPQSLAEKGSMLRTVLRANAGFSFISGAIAIFDAQPLADFFAAGDSTFYMILGALLIAHGLILLFITRNPQVPRFGAWYAIEGDVAWVLASLVIIFTGAFGISEAGKWALFFLSDVVLAFAIAQYIGLRRMNG